MPSQCLKTIEKVSFINSYLYILSGQKFNKNAKNSEFLPETCGLTVLPDMLFLLVENAKMDKFKCDLFLVIFKHCAKLRYSAIFKHSAVFKNCRKYH